jgi:NAD-dependent dihydropyrimidine dehydrogenase PreA subunit
MGTFIRVETLGDLLDTKKTGQLVSICPVEIFAQNSDDTDLIIRPEREDECTLCELCLDVAPAGSLIIHKLYSDQKMISRGGNA